MRGSMLYSGEQILSFKPCRLFYAGDFWWVQTFKEFGYSLCRDNNIIHQNGRPAQNWNLSVFIFI